MRVEDAIAAATSRWTTPGEAGGVVALFEDGRITRSWCMGLADIESGRGWTTATPTRLASLSKHVTAAAAFALGLDGTLGRHLPELRGPLAATTLSRALTMTSGIPDLGETLALSGISSAASIGAERLHRLSCRIAHLNFAPGAEVSYCNTNFRLAQHAAERASGVPLARWLREHFLAPLGLASFALVEDQSEFVPGLASGYWHERGVPRRGAYGLHYSGSGGMVASAEDFVAWTGALLRGDGALRGLFARLAEPGRLASGAEVGYSHGFMLHRLGELRLVGHGGSLPGYKNHFLLDPASGRGVFVASNREETQAQSLAMAALAADLGIDWSPEPPALVPSGLFVDAGTGDTLEVSQGQAGPVAAFLGAEERIFVDEDGRWSSLAPHFPIRIVPASPGADAIQASVGGAPDRTWTRAGGRADPAHAGRYRCEELDVVHEVVARDDGLAISWGGGPVADAPHALRATLPGCHATTTTPTGPWRQRPALRFSGDGFELSSNRSRRWRFARIG